MIIKKLQKEEDVTMRSRKELIEKAEELKTRLLQAGDEKGNEDNEEFVRLF